MINNSKTYGILGIIIALLGFVGLYFSVIAGLILGILSLILCIVQLKKVRTKLAIIGLILSLILIVWAFTILIGIYVVNRTVESTIKSGEAALEKQAAGLGK